MWRNVVLGVGLWVICGFASGQEILRGTLKKLDVENRRVVVAIDGRDREFVLTDDTRVLEATGKDLAERLKGFREGAEIFVRPVKRDDKEVLLGIKLATPGRDTPRERPDQPRRAVVKKFDADKQRITLAVDDREIEFAITDRTQVHGAGRESRAEWLRKLEVGTQVMFLGGKEDGRDVLLGIATGRGDAPAGRRVLSDTSSLKPLSEFGDTKYQGFEGGFYPQGKNERPKEHDEAGRKLAAQVQPLDAAGRPSPQGKIVLLSVGMSNTSQSSQGFQDWLRREERLNPQMQFVNGAQGGMTAAAIQQDESGRGLQYWTVVEERLKQAGVTPEQVQAVWIKQADAGPSQGFPDYAKTLQAELTRIVNLLSKRFPNVKLVYLSSRTYGGYATTQLNPEPYAFESGFAVKWLIEQQIKGDAELNFDASRGAVKAPWLSWGPYLWANGATKRADGFSYEPDDFANDGTHQSASGQRKVGKLMLDFFLSDATTKPWFVRNEK